MPCLRFLLLACLWTWAAIAQSERPNILMIMADDLGFSDLGCYGSEIHTPYLDQMARRGLRFTQFYNTAKCHSSRVSFMTRSLLRSSWQREPEPWNHDSGGSPRGRLFYCHVRQVAPEWTTH